VILYSTYLGGSGFDTGRAIAVDSAGNAYVTGSTNSADFPTTPGAFNTTCTGFCNTSFVTKVLADGGLGYSTFMGGVTGAWAIVVDSAGAAYITGGAGSGLPLVNAFQSVPAGGFAQKLKPDGTALDYSTYLGGGGDWGRGIAVDTSGSAYVVGSTSAMNFPLKNALQSSLLYPLSNAFITKFSPDGASLAFSTYLGGTSPFNSAGDVATGVAIDPLGNIHITGTSSSCEFPLSLNAFNTDCGRISTDPEVFRRHPELGWQPDSVFHVHAERTGGIFTRNRSRQERQQLRPRHYDFEQLSSAESHRNITAGVIEWFRHRT